MDVPSHILDAVQTSAPPIEASPKRVKSTSTRSRKSSTRRYAKSYKAHSSTEDVSSTSDSELDHDYQTDFTTPSNSETNMDDLQPDDVEDFRDREYPQLKDKVYLDHGGTTLYAKSLIEAFSSDLISNLYGNPHSASSPSALAGHRVDEIRERTLRFFGADPEVFDLVFVANASAGIRLVIDCFRDHAAATNTPVWYGYHRDAHTSLVGVRESTKLHRCFTSDEEVELWINSGGLGGPRARQLGLFAYPGQSNMTGRRLPLSWPGRIRKSFHKAATYTLLDAAALATTTPLDLSDVNTAPDFVALSFYKVFGFPNIGALLVRKASAHVLENRRFFGGGTVEMVIAINDTWHAKKDTSIHDRLEDGTLPFHSIFALDHAMSVHELLYGPNPMKFISHHTSQLGKQLYDGLTGLKHSNGAPMIRVYKDESAVYGDPSLQGATIAFNVMRSDGNLVGFEDVEQAADDKSIYVRSGSLCNPGGMAAYLNWSPAEMKAAYASGHRCSNPTQIILGKPTGVVRVSLGAMSTSSDLQALFRFLDETYKDTTGPHVPRSTCVAGPTAPLSPPASPGILPPLNIPHALFVPSQQPPASLTSTVAAGGADHSSREGDATTTALPQTQDAITPAESERPKFVPADYVKLRKPWEDEIRKQQLANGIEIKLRELEDAGLFSRNPTPSIKSRKFSTKSVVNLLRTKSHFVDPARQSPSTPPNLHPDARRTGSASVQLRSQSSLDRLQVQATLKELGL